MDQKQRNNNGDVSEKEGNNGREISRRKSVNGAKNDQDLEKEIFAFSAEKKIPEGEKGKKEILEGEVIEGKEEKNKIREQEERVKKEMGEEVEQILQEKLAKDDQRGASFARFKTELSDALKQAGITQKQVVRGCSCLVIFIVLLIVIWGLIAGDYGKYFGNINFLKKGGDLWNLGKQKIENIISPQKKIARSLEQTEEVKGKTAIGDKDEGVQTALLLGKEEISGAKVFFDPTIYGGMVTGKRRDGLLSMNSSVELQTGMLLGERQKLTMSNFEAYVESLRRLQNILAVDISQEMDQSEDRTKTFFENLTMMKRVLEEASLTIERINTEGLLIKSQYDEVKQQKDAKEVLFFDNLRILSSEISNVALNEFVKLSQSQVELKAYYTAISKVKEYLVPRVMLMQKRVTAIELNQEALIRGIKVIQVQGSDIILVVPEKQAEGK